MDPELSCRSGPDPGLRKKLLRVVKTSLSRVFRRPRGERDCQDPWPFIRGLDILISVTCVLIVLLIVMTVLQQNWRSLLYSPAEPCPEDWMYYQRHCYFFSETEADWETSKNFCFSHGACLLLINNEKELNFITAQMRTSSVWIGLHKTEKEILWLNGSGFDNQMFEMHGKEGCVCIQSKVAAFSNCTIPKSWICRKEPYEREDNFI
uniref:C-type lectin domain family 2 member B-like n=1 Tax=Geotrypetes seraphini TaxID=260995 RepID=A0A6P8P6G0_GEOSA|nr:C-type lectin domain family 2 member B-like [Geotrypetes seraphini]